MRRFEQAVRRWQLKLGLLDWTLRIVADANKANDGESGRHTPSVTLDILAEYKEATLFYDPKAVKGEEDKIACHEMCHLVCEPLRDVLEDALNQAPSQKAREVYGRWASKANESVACHIERVVRNNVPS